MDLQRNKTEGLGLAPSDSEQVQEAVFCEQDNDPWDTKKAKTLLTSQRTMSFSRN